MLAALQTSFREAVEIKLVVSFIMESGVRLLLPDLQLAASRGVPIRILTSRYLGITEPSALYMLRDALGDGLALRVYEQDGIAFHPKSYILSHADGGEVFVGSSNLSQSALLTGVEWNYRVTSREAAADVQLFEEHFQRLFAQAVVVNDDWLKDYSLSWQRPRWLRSGPERTEPEGPEPRGPQIEALHYLKRTRKEGFQRGLVAMATGTGKTFLAAFDSLPYGRILFVAHREEILRQAAASFSVVRPHHSLGFFHGQEKDNKAQLVFASIQTLGQEQCLRPQWFAPDHFDYIVIDEFHHVAAASYRHLVAYFQPKFLLGLTATPFRMDNQDIFQFCDDNIVYEMDVREAIAKDYLAPFHYYGIYDDVTNYNTIDYRAGQYVQWQLETALSQPRRHALIWKHYQRHRGQRALAFCSGIQHANSVAAFFAEKGVRARAVHSGDGPHVLERQQAVAGLQDGELEMLVTVDQFNEGVDIPDIDVILFLRPTQSYTVFLQQLGRGLRKAPNKDKVTVLDFIGNYRQAHLLPLLLTGHRPDETHGVMYQPYKIEDLADQLAEGCRMHWDLALLDVFAEMQKRDPLRERLRTEYWRLKERLGRRPLRLDVFEGSDFDSREFMEPRHVGSQKGYLRFLADVGDLLPEEASWLDGALEDFLRDLEKTHM